MLTTFQRHTNLIKALNLSDLFDKELTVNDPVEKYEELDKNEINASVMLLCDYLHIEHGTAGDIDLYTLLQKYFLDSDVREKINRIIEE
jgi:translation initiation factor 2 beta subunit (eIF-2beta)/eIF-5